MAISTRWSRSPVTRPDQSPSIIVRPSSSRPSSVKNAIAASSDSTTMPTLSIRCSAMRPFWQLTTFTGAPQVVAMRHRKPVVEPEAVRYASRRDARRRSCCDGRTSATWPLGSYGAEHPGMPPPHRAGSGRSSDDTPPCHVGRDVLATAAYILPTQGSRLGFVDARPAPDVYDDEQWELAAAFRVTLWEQPAGPPNIDQPALGWKPMPGAPMGWEEMTFELDGAQDVREAIQWAEATLAS